MLKKLIKAGVGTVLLPIAAAIDVITLPAIAEGDRESSFVKIAKNVIKNIEDVTCSKK